MIPKKIHYCWFGRNPLPASAVKCIQSWKKYFPDYEIIEWNEENYHVNKVQYTREAYAAKKYAFVSDYARFDILYHNGGLYFDTDVEVTKSFEDILINGAFMGCEIDGDCTEKNSILVNPGVGLGIEAGNALYKAIIDYYAKQSFLYPDGKMNTTTVVTRVTELLLKEGLENKKGIQLVSDIYVYPKEYFNPRNNNTGKLERTEKTHSIHWYAQSWDSPYERIKSKITRPIHRVFGEDCFRIVKKMLGRK